MANILDVNKILNSLEKTNVGFFINPLLITYTEVTPLLNKNSNNLTEFYEKAKILQKNIKDFRSFDFSKENLLKLVNDDDFVDVIIDYKKRFSLFEEELNNFLTCETKEDLQKSIETMLLDFSNNTVVSTEKINKYLSLSQKKNNKTEFLLFNKSINTVFFFLEKIANSQTDVNKMIDIKNKYGLLKEGLAFYQVDKLEFDWKRFDFIEKELNILNVMDFFILEKSLKEKVNKKRFIV